MRRAFLAAITAPLLATACASAPKDALETMPQPGLLAEAPAREIPPPTPEEEALALRARAEAARSLAFQAELLWSQWVGLEPPAGHEAPAFLFEAATVLAVERMAFHADEGEAGPWARLFRYLAGEHLDRAVRAEDEAVAEGRRLLLAQGQSIASEAEAAERRRAGEAFLLASEEIRPAVEARAQALRRALEALDHDHPLEAAAGLAGVEAAEILELSASLLRATDSLWAKAFQTAARRALGIDTAELAWVDLPRVFRGAGLDVPLRGRRPAETLEESLAGIGLSLEEVEGLAIDAEAREGRDDRPLCLPLPGGVRLALPVGGGPRHGGLLREVGCALAAARSEEIPPEPVLRAFGGLFARLSAQPDWLVEVGGMTGAEARARASALGLRRLYRLRHHAALLLAEAERGEDQAAFEAAYARQMERAIGVPIPGAIARLERTEILEAIDALRGELLASHLHEAMGEGWWKAPASRTRLTALLDAGAKGAEALLEALGRGALEVGPFVDEMRAALGTSAAIATR